LVVAIATSMTTTRGTAAMRVASPAATSNPHVISTDPTNGPRISGDGRPILAKRPAPSAAGNRNFWRPSETKTMPTRARTRTVAGGALEARLPMNVDRRLTTAE
jgi:hypothetical protein